MRCQTDAGSVSMRLSRANAAHLARMILSSLTVREPFDMDQP
ncbi:MAG TPA: hypothetical protein VF288_10630 [Mycobacteriales bacterium]